MIENKQKYTFKVKTKIKQIVNDSNSKNTKNICENHQTEFKKQI